MYGVLKWLKQFEVIKSDYFNIKYEVLYTFMPNKSYAYMLIVEPRNSVF